MAKVRQGGFLIAKVQLLSERIFSKILAKYELNDISPAQGRILFVLWNGDGISIQELAKKTSLGKSTLTSMLDRLERAGFIKRVPSKEDRRAILIKLTEKDSQCRTLYTKITNEKTRLFYKGFSAREIDAFERYLARIFANLTEFERNDGA
ncbi:MAG: MarR family transcriptional regulator [Nitrospiraceae bacterium]|nr:MarR family transcriptional regulator [Nitrospiraceae bacterium]